MRIDDYGKPTKRTLHLSSMKSNEHTPKGMSVGREAPKCATYPKDATVFPCWQNSSRGSSHRPRVLCRKVRPRFLLLRSMSTSFHIFRDTLSQWRSNNFRPVARRVRRDNPCFYSYRKAASGARVIISAYAIQPKPHKNNNETSIIGPRGSQ